MSFVSWVNRTVAPGVALFDIAVSISSIHSGNYDYHGGLTLITTVTINT